MTHAKLDSEFTYNLKGDASSGIIFVVRWDGAAQRVTTQDGRPSGSVSDANVKYE